MFRHQVFRLQSSRAIVLTVLTLLIVLVALVGNLPGSVHTAHAMQTVPVGGEAFGRGQGHRITDDDITRITTLDNGNQVLTGTQNVHEAGVPGQQVIGYEMNINVQRIGDRVIARQITSVRATLTAEDQNGVLVSRSLYNSVVPTAAPVQRIDLDPGLYHLPPILDIRTRFYPNEFVQARSIATGRMHEFIRLFNPEGVPGTYFQLHITPERVNDTRTPVGHIREDIVKFQQEETNLASALRLVGLHSLFFGLSWLALEAPREIAHAVIIGTFLAYVTNNLNAGIVNTLQAINNLESIQTALVAQYNVAAEAVREPTITWQRPKLGFRFFLGYLAKIFKVIRHDEL